MTPLTPQQQQLVTNNLRLVDFVARKIKIDYGKHGLEYEDIQSIGKIGLIKAASKFDSDRCNKFSSLAVPYIEGEIKHYLRDKTGIIRTPRNKKEKIIHSYDKTFGDDASFIEILGKDDNLHLDNIDEIKAALGQLSPQHRQVLTMFFLNHLNRIEIADWLECTPVTAGRWLEDAKLELKRVLTTESNLKNHCLKRIREDLPYKDETRIHYPHKHHCQVCGNVFGLWDKKITSKTPKTCSNHCANVLGSLKTKRKAWTKQELDYILDLLGKYNLDEITHQLHLHNEDKGLPFRSRVAVEHKAYRLSKTTKRTEDNWSVGDLAKQLGISTSRPRNWCKPQGLKSTRTKGNHRIISRQDLINFVKAKPWLFADINPNALSKILQDDDLVRLCSKQLPYVKRIEVFRTDDKKLYPSVRSLAKDIHMSRINAIDGEWLKISACITCSNVSTSLPDLTHLRDETDVIDPRFSCKKIAQFINPLGIVYQTNNISLLAKVHDLNICSLNKVYNNKQSHHKGWKKHDPITSIDVCKY